MRLREDKLPITLKKARSAFILNYIAFLAAISIGAWFLRVQKSVITAYILFGLGLITFIATEINLRTKRLEIDSNRITQITGLFNIQSKSIYYEDMTDISITQNLLQRILNYGSLKLDTAGTSEYEIDFKLLPNPEKVRNFLEVLENKYVISRSGQKK